MKKEGVVVFGFLLLSIFSLVFLAHSAFASMTLPATGGGNYTYNYCSGTYYVDNSYCTSIPGASSPCKFYLSSSQCSAASGCTWVSSTKNASCDNTNFNSNVTLCMDTYGCSPYVTPSCSSGTTFDITGNEFQCLGTYSGYGCTSNSTTAGAYCNSVGSTNTSYQDCMINVTQDCMAMTTQNGCSVAYSGSPYTSSTNTSLCEWVPNSTLSCSNINASQCGVGTYSSCSAGNVSTYGCASVCSSGYHYGSYTTTTSTTTCTGTSGYSCTGTYNGTHLDVTCGSATSNSSCQALSGCSWTVDYCTSANCTSGVSGCSWQTTSSSSTSYGCIQNTCSDSDGGINYGTKGTVTSNIYDGTDYCVNSTTLNEYYCNLTDNTPHSTYFNCPYGCSVGACNSQPTNSTTPSLYFENSQSQIPTSVSSSSLPQNMTLVAQNYTYSSSSSFTLYERVYKEVSTLGRISWQETYPSKVIGVFSGASSGSPAGSSTISASVWQLTNSSLNMSVADNTTNVFYFSIGGYNSTNLSVTYNGLHTSSVTATCTDTDGGKNYTVQGTVNVNGSSSGFTDSCVNATELTEYYCSPLNNSAAINVSCSCSSGACAVAPSYCGDGLVQSPDGSGIKEVCDFGSSLNGKPGVACTSQCTRPTGVTQNAYWTNATQKVSYINEGGKNAGQFSVTLVLENNTAYPNSFAIYDAYNSTQPIENFTSYNLDNSENSIYKWTPSSSDFASATNKSGNYTFYFVSEGIKSGNLTIHYNPSFQCMISLCSQYTTQSLCGSDPCNVAPNGPVSAGQQAVACAWSSSASTCGPLTSFTGPVGTFDGSVNCSYITTSKNENCSAGFLKTSWSATINWGNDVYGNYSKMKQVAGYTIVNDSKTGPYHYQKDGFTCNGGSAQIPCPAQVELNFFDWRNLIAAVVLIFVLYMVIAFNNKKKSKSKKSSKKSASKKVNKKK